LLEGKKIRVEGHGMSIETSKLDSHNILETEIILMDKKHAGLKTYAKILNDEDIKYEKWNIQELLYSIPEISSFVSQDDLNLKYVIPSTLLWDEDETFHKISNIYEDKIKDVINFDKNYLPVG